MNRVTTGTAGRSRRLWPIDDHPCPFGGGRKQLLVCESASEGWVAEREVWMGQTANFSRRVLITE